MAAPIRSEPAEVLRPSRPPVGPYGALARYLSDRYLPSLVGSVTQGLAQKADFLSYPMAQALSIEDEAGRAHAYRTIKAALIHDMPAFAYATGAATLRNVGDPAGVSAAGNMAMAQALLGEPIDVDGLRAPFEPLAATMREKFVEHSLAAEEMVGPDSPLAHRILRGAVAAPLMLAEGVAATAVLGPLGFPAVMANRAARDPVTGEFTGPIETAKGAAKGALMHGIGAGAALLPTMAQRATTAGAGFAGLAALEGAEDKDVAAAFVLGGGMQAMMPRRQPRATREFLELQQRRVEQFRDAQEKGVPRSPIEPGDVEFVVEPVGTLGQEIPRWQKHIESRRIEPESQLGTLVRELEIPEWLPADLEIAFVEQQVARMGGGRAYFEAVKGPKSWEDTMADAEQLVGRALLGEDFQAGQIRRREGRGFDENEMAAAEIVVLKRLERQAEANGAVVRGEEGAEAQWLRRMADTVVSSYEAEAGKATAGRTLNILKRSKQERLKAAAMAKLVEEHQAHVRAGKPQRPNEPVSDEALLEMHGGKEQVRELAAAMSRLDDPAEVLSVLKMTKDSAERGLAWKGIDIWLAGLLSAPSTHKTNIQSNALFSGLFHMVEQPLEAGIGLAKIPLQRGVLRAEGELAHMRASRSEFAQEPTDLASWQQRYDFTQGKAGFLQEHAKNSPLNAVLMKQRQFTVPGTGGGKIDYSFRGLGLDTTDRVYFQEVMAQLYGLKQSLPFAVEAMQKAWMNDAEFAPHGIKGGTPYGAGEMQKSLPPFRALTSADALFKASSYAARLYGLGMREAVDRGVPLNERYAYTEKFVKEVNHAPRNATKKRKNELRRYSKEAMERASELTFTNDVGNVGKALERLSNSHPLMKVVLSFVRTPINVSKQGIYRAPGVAFLAPRTWADLAAGGQRQNAAVARMAAGGLLGLAFYDRAMNGDTTGASSPQSADLELDRAFGIAPFSNLTLGIAEDLIYQSYARLEPLATPIAVTSTLVDWQQRGLLTDTRMAEMGPLLAAAGAENIVNKSYLQGPQGLMDAATAPQRKLSRYVEQLAGSLVPSAINTIARSLDPYRRDQTGLPEAIMARLPFEWARESLPVMHDLAGRKMTTGDPGAQFFARTVAEYSTPFRPTKVLDAMAISGSRVQRVSQMLRVNVGDFVSQTDPRMVTDALRRQRETYIEMTPHQREYVNEHGNRAAGDELDLTIDALYRTADKLKLYSMEELEAKGTPPQVIRSLMAEGIARAGINEAMRRTISEAYLRHRTRYARDVVAKWREEGRLRKELDLQLGREKQRSEYDSAGRGGSR